MPFRKRRRVGEGPVSYTHLDVYKRQAVLCMLYLMRVNESYKVVLRKIRIHKTVAIRIIQVGVPTAIQNTVISFANVLVQASVNSYGALAMAGFAAYIKIDGFNILPVMSFSMAATTFSGQNYGAGNMERVRKGMRDVYKRQVLAQTEPMSNAFCQNPYLSIQL